MPDRPEEQHLAAEDGGLLLAEDGGALLLELQEHVSRIRQEGEPYQFLVLEDGSGDLLLEEQPRASATVR